MKSISLISVLILAVLFAACSKQDEQPKTDSLGSTQNIQHQDESNPQNNINSFWLGQYIFEESVINAAGTGSHSWNWVITVSPGNDSALNAKIDIDGFQTMTRIEAKAFPKGDELEFVFEKYGKDNMYNLLNKGDKLLKFKKDPSGIILTYWDYLKPFALKNRKDALEMFKKLPS